MFFTVAVQKRIVGKLNFNARIFARMEHTNRLANEKSPYLLQHKNNPINWYAWGQDAFDEAKRRNVPIFLSVGYSTCHWCHVMEKESFENQKIADILNEHYVSIKVDREERPDVDKLYMAFIQAISGGGGWPMSVFLTPDLSPVTGGTYFPPDDSRGRPGFASILRLIADKWTENPQQILDQGKALMDAIKNNIGSEPGDAPPSKQVCSDAFAYLCKRFDRQRGGFGSAPKFPKPVDLDFLIHCAVHPDSPTEARLAYEMVDRTLDAMDRGGIHDHVGKGFHRYSVDADWHVPHFEKMLYDQAQLLATYSEWHMLTGNYEHVVRDIVDYVDGNLTHPAGGFYSAEDADSLPEPDAPHKREGAFCVWTQTEIEELLKNWKAGEHPLSEVISAYFDIEEDGNVPPSVDPHGELTGQNVLIMRRSHEEYATQFGLNEGELRTAVGEAKAFLASRRALRPKPHLDSKIVTCWQGLMLSGLCRATVSLKDTTILEKALKNFDFIREHLVDSNGDLKRAVYTGENGSVEQTSTPIGAFSDDYAFLIQALLDLHEITFDQKYLEWATDLQKRLDANFWDTEKEGGYFVSSKATSDSPGVRMMEDQDGAEPCGNSVSFCNLIRLYEITDRKAYRDTAEKLLRAAAQRLNRFPYILCKMLAAYARLHEGNTKIVVVGKLDDARTKTFLDYVQGVHVWNKAVVLLDPLLEDSWLEIECPAYKEMRTRCQQPTVFVCQGFTCGLPITSGEELKNRLDELVSHVSPQAKKEEDSSCKRK